MMGLRKKNEDEPSAKAKEPKPSKKKAAKEKPVKEKPEPAPKKSRADKKAEKAKTKDKSAKSVEKSAKKEESAGQKKIKELSKSIINTFSNDQHDDISEGDYARILIFALENNLFDAAEVICENTANVRRITRDNLVRQKLGKCIQDRATGTICNMFENHPNVVKSVFSSDLSLQNALANYYSGCKDYMDVDSRAHALEHCSEYISKDVAPLRARYLGMVSDYTLQIANKRLYDDFNKIQDVSSLKEYLESLKGFESQCFASDSFRNPRTDACWDKTRTLMHRDAAQLKSPGEIDWLDEQYGALYKSCSWITNEATYSTTISREKHDISVALAVTELMMNDKSFKDYVTTRTKYAGLPFDTVSDGRFVDAYRNAAKSALKECKDIEEIIDLNVPSARDQDIQATADILMKDFTLAHLREQDSVAGLTATLARPTDIIRSNVVVLQAYAKAMVKLLLPVDKRIIPGLEDIYSEDRVQKDCIILYSAMELSGRLDEIPSDGIYAWQGFFKAYNDTQHEDIPAGPDKDAAKKLYWKLSLTIGYSLLESNPEEAESYLRQVGDMDPCMLMTLAAISRGQFALRNGDVEEAKTCATEAIDISDETEFAGKAFATHAFAADNSLDAKTYVDALKDVLATIKAEKLSELWQASVESLVRAFVVGNPYSARGELVSVQAQIEGQFKMLDCLSYITRAIDSVSLWDFRNANGLIQTAEKYNVAGYFDTPLRLLKDAVSWGMSDDASAGSMLKEDCEAAISNETSRFSRWIAYLFRGYVYESDNAWVKAISSYESAMRLTDEDRELKLMCARLYLANGEQSRISEVLEGLDDPISELIKLEGRIASGDFRVRPVLRKIEVGEGYPTALKSYVEGLSHFAAGSWNDCVNSMKNALDNLNQEASRQATLLAVNILTTRAEAYVNITSDNIGIANSDMESALEALDRFSGNMHDVALLWKQIETKKAVLGSKKEPVVAATSSSSAEFRIIGFDGVPYSIQGDAIGTGGNYKVYLARSNDGKQYAIRVHKKINPYKKGTDALTNVELKAFNDEISIWTEATAVAGDYVVRLLSDKYETDFPAILMEYASGSYVDKKNMSRREKMDAFRSLLRALDALHEAGIVHNDVKPDNLLDVGGTWKLADFDTSFFEGDPAPTVRGTTEYKSPEIFNGEEVTGKSDIWAAGVFLYKLLVTFPPFDGSEQTYAENVKNGKVRMDRIENQKPQYVELFRRVFSADPEKRPTAGEFLAEVDRILEEAI